MNRVAVVALIILLLLGGIGRRETSANAGAIAAGITVMAAGAGISYGGCVAMKAVTRPDVTPATLPPEPVAQYPIP